MLFKCNTLCFENHIQEKNTQSPIIGKYSLHLSKRKKKKNQSTTLQEFPENDYCSTLLPYHFFWPKEVETFQNCGFPKSLAHCSEDLEPNSIASQMFLSAATWKIQDN